MNLTVRQLRAFTLVVEKGSFTAAGHAMHLTQSAVSILVRDLEEELGSRLIDRTTRSIAVTTVGQEFFASAQRILIDLEHAIGNVDKLITKQRGRVVVAAPLVLSSTLLPSILATFGRLHPGVDVLVLDSLTDQVLPNVRSGAADLGIGTFRKTEADLSSTLLFREPLVAIFLKHHAFSRASRLTWKDLRGNPILALRSGSVFRELTQAGLAAAELPLEPAFEATYSGTLIGWVKAGLGVAIVPAHATALVDQRRFGWKRLEKPAIEREVLMVHRAGVSLSPAAQAFAEHLLEHGPSSAVSAP
ncbi:LysR family transcriptional regulator [Ramlibacter sp. WS9]|uniref:LysR family transcriptional regulator n=1 Tax=Ramlibacter sp. WS9 TaxID=1882741 RepID=UPI0011421BDC|nr:LysR family transcriptional regulator [Ramlibacter sp. WS9]ROZ78843.1 LysR family transcriptional regulator [Ramlibacter sp. WS9]